MATQSIRDSIEKTKEFLELWLKFSQIYKEAVGRTSITPEEEGAFLETKSIVARRFQRLADSLAMDRETIDRTYDVINQILSLKSISSFPEHVSKKIENDWHESYISLNRLLGSLEAKKDTLDYGKATGAKPGSFIPKAILYVVMVIVSVMIIIFLAYILYSAYSNSPK